MLGSRPQVTSGQGAARDPGRHPGGHSRPPGLTNHPGIRTSKGKSQLWGTGAPLRQCLSWCGFYLLSCVGTHCAQCMLSVASFSSDFSCTCLTFVTIAPTQLCTQMWTHMHTLRAGISGGSMVCAFLPLSLSSLFQMCGGNHLVEPGRKCMLKASFLLFA